MGGEHHRTAPAFEEPWSRCNKTANERTVSAVDEVSAKIPAQHGVERAAARLHRMAAAREPKQQWRNLDEGIRRTLAEFLREREPA